MRKGKHTKNKSLEFSKRLLVQESALIWVHTLAIIILAYICVLRGYYAELPWLTAMVSFPWGAYAISQREYYVKARQENTKNGIVFETAMLEHYNDEVVG